MWEDGRAQFAVCFGSIQIHAGPPAPAAGIPQGSRAQGCSRGSKSLCHHGHGCGQASSHTCQHGAASSWHTGPRATSLGAGRAPRSLCPLTLTVPAVTLRSSLGARPAAPQSNHTSTGTGWGHGTATAYRLSPLRCHHGHLSAVRSQHSAPCAQPRGGSCVLGGLCPAPVLMPHLLCLAERPGTREQQGLPAALDGLQRLPPLRRVQPGTVLAGKVALALPGCPSPAPCGGCAGGPSAFWVAGGRLLRCPGPCWGRGQAGWGGRWCHRASQAAPCPLPPCLCPCRCGSGR